MIIGLILDLDDWSMQGKSGIAYFKNELIALFLDDTYNDNYFCVYPELILTNFGEVIAQISNHTCQRHNLYMSVTDMIEYLHCIDSSITKHLFVLSNNLSGISDDHHNVFNIIKHDICLHLFSITVTSKNFVPVDDIYLTVRKEIDNVL